MRRTYLHLSAGEFKDRFSNALQHHKKIKALENFQLTKLFSHARMLQLIKECISTDFLESEEEKFLEHLLTKYEVDYLAWCHRTKWLKGEIQRKEKKIETKKASWTPEQFDLFDKNLKERYSRVPIDVLILQQNQNGRLHL